MGRNLRILGDGQIWDLRRIAPDAPQRTFEDLFSGRALGEMAKERKAFSAFKDKGRITGFSVTKALLSSNREVRNTATALLKDLARNAALGIEALNRGTGYKPRWTAQEKNYWSNLDAVIIGGGVSEGKTGKILVSAIKRYLSQNGLSHIEIFQAEFPGKEAGFQGAVINIIRLICNEAKIRGLKAIGAVGLDLGREEIGVGLLAVKPKGPGFLKQGKHYWLFRSSAGTPGKNHLKKFLDSRRDYTKIERKLGERLRRSILRRMADLIVKAQSKARELGLEISRNIGIAVPGSVSDGYIINSTDYLPFFRKQDGFNFTKDLEELLVKSDIPGCRVHIVNDGIAAGLANTYFSKANRGKFAFLGVGSGLGGCAGLIN